MRLVEARQMGCCDRALGLFSARPFLDLRAQQTFEGIQQIVDEEFSRSSL